jgi:hypothetical protein
MISDDNTDAIVEPVHAKAMPEDQATPRFEKRSCSRRGTADALGWWLLDVGSRVRCTAASCSAIDRLLVMDERGEGGDLETCASSDKLEKSFRFNST